MALLQHSVLCKLTFLFWSGIPQMPVKGVKIGPKHNHILFQKPVFGLFIASWSRYQYMYVGLLYNVNPTSTFPHCNAHQTLTELSMWFKCVQLGQNRFDDLEQHFWAPVADLSHNHKNWMSKKYYDIFYQKNYKVFWKVRNHKTVKNYINKEAQKLFIV